MDNTLHFSIALVVVASKGPASRSDNNKRRRRVRETIEQRKKNFSHISEWRNMFGARGASREGTRLQLVCILNNKLCRAIRTRQQSSSLLFAIVFCFVKHISRPIPRDALAPCFMLQESEAYLFKSLDTEAQTL